VSVKSYPRAVPTNEELRALAQEYGAELKITNAPALTKGGEIILFPGVRRAPTEPADSNEAATERP
jgi:hypothetical protein